MLFYLFVSNNISKVYQRSSPHPQNKTSEHLQSILTFTTNKSNTFNMTSRQLGHSDAKQEEDMKTTRIVIYILQVNSYADTA